MCSTGIYYSPLFLCMIGDLKKWQDLVLGSGIKIFETDSGYTGTSRIRDTFIPVHLS
jgi:hypothetical protein